MDPYDGKNIQNIIKRNRKIEYIFKLAHKDISNRIKQFTIRHPIYEGSFYKFNRPMEKKIDELLKKLQMNMADVIEDGMVQGWELSNTKNSELVDNYLKSIMPPEPAILKSMHQLNLSAMHTFIDRTERGMNLSQRIWHIMDGTKEQLQTYLASGITTGKSAVEISKDLEGFMAGKGVQYKGVLIKRRNIKFEAIRLVATEVNMAYRTGDFMRRQQLPFVTGVRVHLSSSHPMNDMCDSLVGDYPKGFLFTGWHPLCICFSTSIMLKKDDFMRQMKTGKVAQSKYIKTIPKNATGWINKNKKVISGWKSRPYFLQDNFTKDFKLRKDAIMGGEGWINKVFKEQVDREKKRVSKVA